MIEHNPLSQAMIDAVSQTLENMAFTEVMQHYDQNFAIQEDELVWTYLMILDPIQGEIRLALSRSTLKELTTAIFAMDEEDVTQAQMADIMNEILNTVAGLFMTNLLTANQQFKIGLPEPGEGPLPDDGDDMLSWKLMTGEENPLQIYLSGASIAGLKD